MKRSFAERDAVGNILIRKPATKGMEDRKTVVLQAHLDMVPQKTTIQFMTSLKIQFNLILTVNGSKQKAQH